MQPIAKLAMQIREHTYSWNSAISSDIKAKPNEWNRFCATMDVLGDTCLALEDYEVQGIGRNDGEKYIRLYGVLQSVFLQQDSISHLFKILTGQDLTPEKSSAWHQIREVRNLAVGHPVEAEWCQKHCFISRVTIKDDGFQMIIWDKDKHEDEFRNVGLRSLYESYKSEALEYLNVTYKAQLIKWPALQ